MLVTAKTASQATSSTKLKHINLRQVLVMFGLKRNGLRTEIHAKNPDLPIKMATFH